VITRVRPTCASWLPHGASYDLPYPGDAESTIVVHHVHPGIKTIVVQEIEDSRGHGGYWCEGDVLIQPGVRIEIKSIDRMKDFESFNTSMSNHCRRLGPVRIVHTQVTPLQVTALLNV
jgi:hypothetical protein